MKRLIIGKEQSITENNEAVYVERVFAPNDDINCDNVLVADELTCDEYRKCQEYISEFRFRLTQHIYDTHRQWGISKEECDFVFGGTIFYICFNMYWKYIRLKDLDFEEYCVDYMEKPNMELFPSQLGGRLCNDFELNSYIYYTLCKWFGIKVIGCEDIKKNHFAVHSKNNENIVYSLTKHLYSLLYRYKKYIECIRVKERCNTLLLRTFLPDDIVLKIKSEYQGQIEILDYDFWNQIDLYIETLDKFGIKKENQKWFAEFNSQNDFETYCISELDNFVPTAWKKYIRKYLKIGKKMSKRIDVAKIYSAAYVPAESIAATVFVAKKIKEGKKIYNIQHSFNYASANMLDYNENTLFEKMIYWGKTGDGVSLPSIRVPNKWGEKKQGVDAGRLLLITNDFSNFEIGIGCCCENIGENHFSFVSALNDNNRDMLTVRFRDDAHGLRNVYINKYASVCVEDMYSKSLEESIAESRIFILDHISTPFIECLLSNKVVLLYDGLKLKYLRPEMKDYLERFKELNVYFESGRELAEYINREGIEKVENNFNNDLMLKELKTEFVDYFMGTLENSSDVWIREFLD